MYLYIKFDLFLPILTKLLDLLGFFKWNPNVFNVYIDKHCIWECTHVIWLYPHVVLITYLYVNQLFYYILLVLSLISIVYIVHYSTNLCLSLYFMHI